MAAARRLARLLDNLFRRRARDRDLDEEIESYLALAADEKARGGMDREAARRRVLAEMGGVEHVRIGVRERRAGYGVEALGLDLAFGLRLLARHPASSVVATATMALGIAASAAMFAVVHAVLLAPLPYPGADRLAFVGPTSRDGRPHFSPPDFVDFRESSAAFERLAAIQGGGLVTLSARGATSVVRAREVTSGVLAVYGVSPLVGRALQPSDEDATRFAVRTDPASPAPPGAALISHRLWLERFGGDRAAIGQLVQLDFQPYEIVGVTPPGFEVLIPDEADYRAPVDVLVATRMDFPTMPRDAAFLRVVGRLRPEATIEAARAEATLFAARQRTAHAVHRDDGYEIAVTSLLDSMTRRHAPAVALLFAGAVFLLVIACTNLGGLVLTRAVAREREFALRLALGAGRGRVARQVVTEGALHAVFGVALALPLAWWLLQGLVRMAPASIPRLDQVTLGTAPVLFACAEALVSTTGVSLAAAARLTRTAAIGPTRHDTRTIAGSGPGSWEGALVTAAVAASVVTLVGTLLLAASLSRLLQVQPGFDAEGVLTADFFLAEQRYPRYPRPDARVRFVRAIADRVSRLPGVDAAGLALVVPLGGQDAGHSYASEAMASALRTPPPARYRPVTPGYFDAIGTRLLSGRDFDWVDVEQHRLVSVVDRRLAERAWPGEEAVGRRLRIERWTTANGGIGLEPLWTEVVGVVENVRSADLGADDIETVYLPYSLYAVAELSVLLRASVKPATLAEPLRAEFARVDPEVPLLGVREMSEVVAQSVAPQRFEATLLAIFGLTGLTLALIGVYAALAHVVGLRRREIGIRLALGATPADARRLVLLGGGRVLAAGIGIGLMAALLLSRLLATRLYGVSPVDAAVYAATAALVLLAGLAACYVPARRASRLDPVATLRAE
ncbi:MAG: ADOP family duplicated permease [Vicinamibacterales bacterium]